MQLQRAAHTLKGLAPKLGGQRAVAAGAEFEKFPKNRQSMGVPAALDGAKEAFDEFIGKLAPAARNEPHALRSLVTRPWSLENSWQSPTTNDKGQMTSAN